MPYTLQMKGKKTITVDSFRAAAVAWSQANYIGRGSAFYTREMGLIRDESGVAIARISPNGRVWAGATWAADAALLCEAVY